FHELVAADAHLALRRAIARLPSRSDVSQALLSGLRAGGPTFVGQNFDVAGEERHEALPLERRGALIEGLRIHGLRARSLRDEQQRKSEQFHFHWPTSVSELKRSGGGLESGWLRLRPLPGLQSRQAWAAWPSG